MLRLGLSEAAGRTDWLPASAGEKDGAVGSDWRWGSGNVSVRHGLSEGSATSGLGVPFTERTREHGGDRGDQGSGLAGRR